MSAVHGFRRLIEYDFDLYRELWAERLEPLSDNEFTAKIDYSVGSLRHQYLHMMDAEQGWWAILRGEKPPRRANPTHYPNRDKVKAYRAEVEIKLRAHSRQLKDEHLTQTYREFEGWEMLFHLINHSIDHRGQCLVMTRRDEEEISMRGFLAWRINTYPSKPREAVMASPFNAAQFRELYRYYYALNQRLWSESIDTLSDEQYKQPVDKGGNAVANVSARMLRMEMSWMVGLRGENNPFSPRDDTTRAQMRLWRSEIERRSRAYIAALRDSDLTDVYTSQIGSFPIWEVLIHVLLFGTDQRAQALAMLYRLQAPTFEQDYAVWKRDQRSQG